MKTKLQLLPLALLALSPALAAQQIPGAGTQLRQLTPPPAPPISTPSILIEEKAGPATPGIDSTSVMVRELRITGARAWSEAELLRVTGFASGSVLTLGQLHAMADRITAYYRSHGYFVARADLPAQEIANNSVTIVVSEGIYDKITLRNHSHLSDAVVANHLQGLDHGDAITLAPLEQRLLLLSDLPGVRINSTLVPGTLPGSSDLLVDVEPWRRVSGMIYADNAGNPYTGEWRLGATVNFNNLMGRGDVASLQAMSSGSGLVFGRASYQVPFGSATAGVAYSHLDYELGRQFELLGAHGTADVASVFGSYSLIRSRRSNLTLGAIYEDKRLEDELDLFPADGRRADARVVGLSLHGNHQDDLGDGGTTSFYVAASAGSLDIRTPAARIVDAATARTNGSYEKVWFNVSRLQRFGTRLSVNASLSGQLASKNLDPSEKLVLGGMEGIRAYPQGEAFGDEGYIANLEARLLLAGASQRLRGDLHLLGFVEAGHVRINAEPWDASPNERDLRGAGVGMAWNDPGNFSVRAYYAFRLGDEPAMSAPDQSGRFWIQAVKYF
jgi:hemolysin activation/secretion protein